MALSTAAMSLAYAPAAPVVGRASAVRMSVPPPPALESLAKELNPVLGYYDPLGLGTADFWEKGNDATVGFLRHAEIKHGRVAMAAFVGYIAQYNGLHFGFPLSLPAETNAQYAAGLTPPEQWDALTFEGKFQIIVFIGFLEFWSELGQSIGEGHYMKGGKPGMYPAFPEKNVIPFTPAGLLNLYDPFNLSKNRTPEAKAKGLLAEVNNGRLAMLGIMGFLAEQKVPGAVPALAGLVKPYAGEVMQPF